MNKLLFILIISFLCVGCSKDEDTDFVDENLVEGIWYSPLTKANEYHKFDFKGNMTLVWTRIDVRTGVSKLVFTTKYRLTNNKIVLNEHSSSALLYDGKIKYSMSNEELYLSSSKAPVFKCTKIPPVE